MLKDFTITAKQTKRELLILLGCFLAAVGVNVYSIIRYSTPWTEIFTQIGYTLIITAAVYAVSIIVRLVVWAICLLARKWRA